MTEQQKPQKNDRQDELTPEELTKVSGGQGSTVPRAPGITAEDDWETPLKAPKPPEV